jgi:hypothetical protein
MTPEERGGTLSARVAYQPLRLNRLVLGRLGRGAGQARLHQRACFLHRGGGEPYRSQGVGERDTTWTRPRLGRCGLGRRVLFLEERGSTELGWLKGRRAAGRPTGGGVRGSVDLRVPPPPMTNVPWTSARAMGREAPDSARVHSAAAAAYLLRSRGADPTVPFACSFRRLPSRCNTRTGRQGGSRTGADGGPPGAREAQAAARSDRHQLTVAAARSRAGCRRRGVGIADAIRRSFYVRAFKLWQAGHQ